MWHNNDGAAMQVKHDARVITNDGQDVGRIDRVVIDPRTRMPSHLVVCRGGLFATDRVLPIEWVGEAQVSELLLRIDPHELESLPTFEETSYVAGEQAEGIRSKDRGLYALPYYYYPPVHAERKVAAFLYPDVYGQGLPMPVAHKDLDRPPYPDVGARAMSGDSQYVGEVEDVIADADTGHVTHFVISRGLLVKDHILIPLHWILSAPPDELRISVSARLIGRLPDWDPESRST